jgi:hypothetical protein
MPVGITDLAHSIRKNTATSAVPIPLSRGQQLVCAALGHKSLASFQAGQSAEREPQQLDAVPHVVPDYELLATRASELGLAVTEQRLGALMDSALEERLPKTRVHRSFSDLAMAIQDEMQDLVIADDEVNSSMANANYDGIDEIYFEDEVDPDQATVEEPLTATVLGQVNLGIDTERPYSGHQVQFEVSVTLARSGRRCFESAEIEVLSAALDQDWGDPDDIGMADRAALAQALAAELNIEVAEAQQLTDIEPQELTGSSGEMTYGYLFDFDGQVSPRLAARLMQQHGSLKLEVGPSFFEGLRGPDEPN